MKKIKLIMPMLATAGIAGMAMPLASCSCGSNDPAVTVDLELEYKDYQILEQNGYFSKNAIKEEVTRTPQADYSSAALSTEEGKTYTIACELKAENKQNFLVLMSPVGGSETESIVNDTSITVKHNGENVPFTYITTAHPTLGTYFSGHGIEFNWPNGTVPTSGTLVITFKAAISRLSTDNNCLVPFITSI